MTASRGAKETVYTEGRLIFRDSQTIASRTFEGTDWGQAVVKIVLADYGR